MLNIVCISATAYTPFDWSAPRISQPAAPGAFSMACKRARHWAQHMLCHSPRVLDIDHGQTTKNLGPATAGAQTRGISVHSLVHSCRTQGSCKAPHSLRRQAPHQHTDNPKRDSNGSVCTESDAQQATARHSSTHTHTLGPRARPAGTARSLDLGSATLIGTAIQSHTYTTSVQNPPAGSTQRRRGPHPL